jgi:hypothetical protein
MEAPGHLFGLKKPIRRRVEKLTFRIDATTGRARPDMILTGDARENRLEKKNRTERPFLRDEPGPGAPTTCGTLGSKTRKWL